MRLHSPSQPLILGPHTRTRTRRHRRYPRRFLRERFGRQRSRTDRVRRGGDEVSEVLVEGEDGGVGGGGDGEGVVDDFALWSEEGKGQRKKKKREGEEGNEQ
jgi:hypothetical protein